MAFRIRRGKPPSGQAVSLAIRECGRVQRALQKADEGDLQRSIHKARQHAKRLRALLRLVREPMGRKQISEIERLVAEAARHLAGSRDRQVCLDTFERVAKACQLSQGARATLKAQLAELLPHQAPDTKAFFRMMTDARARLESLSYKESAATRTLLHACLQKTVRKEKKSLRTALKSSSPKAMHAWRKILKRMNTQYQLLDADRLKPATRRMNAKLALKLGRLHDLDILIGHLEHLPGEDARTALATATRQRHKLAARCLQLGTSR